MLFEPDRHEALIEAGWDAPRVRDAIRSIARDLEQAHGADGRWPLHPLDDEGDEPSTGFKNLYLGRAGVLWALWYLQREGAIELAIDPRALLLRAEDAYRRDPDGGTALASYLLGESGILLASWALAGSGAAADRLHALVRANIHNPTNEALWGAPGTMLAAWHLWQATAEDRWRALFLENVEQVWQRWTFDEHANCHLWTQHLDGKDVQYLGAGHGFAGNVHPLLKGAALLEPGQREALYDRCVETLHATARFDGDAVNWPPGTYEPRPGRPRMLVQWCHGAPGIVAALSDFPRHRSPRMEAMLAGAGHAIWRAGPLAKGPGLCHGTAGNGLAFLTLFERTGEASWLDRARAFALHALSQQERLRRAHGHGRATLWTGDAGLAVFLWHCLQGKAGLPTLDLLR